MKLAQKNNQKENNTQFLRLYRGLIGSSGFSDLEM